jgi:hypothetical protein
MAKVYVGTYKKYNEGSLKGAWLTLENYKSYEDFVKACKELHKDESYPELMIQDTSDFPDGLECGEWISKEEFDDVIQAIKEEEEPKFKVIDYSDKAIAVVGDTYDIKDQLKALKGKYNRHLSCGAGWIFPKSQQEALEKLLNSGVVALSDKGEDLWKEYEKEMLKVYPATDTRMWKYLKKEYSSAVKLTNGGIVMFKKQSIDTAFCWADEGPQYEEYKEVTNTDDKLKNYFIAKNLSKLDRDIELMENNFEGRAKRWYIIRHSYGLSEPLNLYYFAARCSSDFQHFAAHEEATLMSDEDRQIILAGLKKERDKFANRLNSYLKRYGTKKIRTWTYWQDA